MSRAVVPIVNLSRRLPELGRLKFGDTNAKGGRRAIDKWRVVSNHEDCLADIAGLYGGTPKPYSHPKSDLHFDLHTTSDVLKVGLQTYSGEEIVSLNYERWGGGGCERRCDGATVTTWAKGPDGPEETDQPCLCAAAGELSCDIKLRVSFFLPGVSRFGVWRLETGSWNAVAEMRGMAELLLSLRARGITEAELALAPRSDVKAGQTRNYVVPEIRLAQNFQALMAGGGQMAAVAAPSAGEIGAGAVDAAGSRGTPTPEIPAAASEGPPPPDDDEPIEAEIVDEPAQSSWLADQREKLNGGDFPPGWSDLAGPGKTKALKAARAVAERHGVTVPSSFDEIDPDLAVAAMAEAS